MAVPMLVSASCFVLPGFAQGHLPLAITLMGLGAAAGMCAVPLFWTIPPAFLATANAAAGIALISCMGNLSGVVSQVMVGAIKSATGSLYLAFDVIGVALVLGAVVLLVFIPARQPHERRLPVTTSDRPLSLAAAMPSPCTETHA